MGASIDAERVAYRSYFFEIRKTENGWRLDIAAPGGDGFACTLFGPNLNGLIQSAERFADRHSA